MNERHWWLHELRRLRACRLVGSMGDAALRKERRDIIRELVKLRRDRPVCPPLDKRLPMK